MWLEHNHERSELKWGGDPDGHFITYQIGKTRLEEAVGRFKEPLERLTRWSTLRDANELTSILVELGDAGANLRFVLFKTDTDIGDLAEWMEDQYADDKQLTITADPTFHVPWALVFDKEQGTSIDGNEDALWCLKYKFGVKFSSCDAPSRRMKRSRADMQVVSLINRSFSDIIKSNAKFYKLIGDPDGITWNTKECEAKLETLADRDTIFHFFGHGEENKLIVDTNEVLDPNKFEMLMDRITARKFNLQKRTIGLVILNACESILSTSDYSILSATAREGLCGAIATEAKVPQDFAIEYSERLLSKLIDEGLSVGEAVDLLRRADGLWPLTLLYGCYAKRDYRFVQEAAE